MAWNCNATPRMGSLIFIDDVTRNGSSRIKSEDDRHILSSTLQRNTFIVLHHTARQWTKHTVNPTKDFVREIKMVETNNN